MFEENAASISRYLFIQLMCMFLCLNFYFLHRLCEVCNHVEAKYTCPKCEVKTCCLKCVNIHKKELECNGIRDKTKFIPIKDMTNIDFMSDYTFLEQCTRYVSDRKSDKLKHHTRFNKNLPAHMFKLRCAAHERKINLKFLLKIFTKHNVNTTFYDWKEKIIHWRIEWIFSHAQNVKFVDERCSEHDSLNKLLTKYLTAPTEPTDSSILINKHLEYYQSKDQNELQVLLKAEGVKGCKRRFFAMDMAKTLKDNLAGKTIVEFPIMYVVYKDITSEFNVIDSGMFLNCS